MVSLCCGFFWRKNNKCGLKVGKLGNEETVQGFVARIRTSIVAWQCEGDHNVPSSIVNVFENLILFLFNQSLLIVMNTN